MKEDEIRKREVFNRYLQLVAEDTKDFFKAGELEEISCPACSSINYKDEFRKADFVYVLCQDCGTLFVNPRPSVERLKNFYSVSPSSQYWVEKFFKPVAEIRREKIFKPRAEYIKVALPEMEQKTVGDIGAGFGLFLEELQKLLPKNRYIAIEPSLDMAQICKNKGFEVITDFLENIKDKHKNSFFLLTGFELFEHLREPKYFLEKVYALLNPGGHLLLATLNGEGFDIQILWENSKSIFPPHHLNFFNPRSIKMLLEECGFIIEEISTPGKLDWDIVEGMIQNDGVDAGRFWNVLLKEGTEAGKKELQKWISKNNFSSHMRVLAKKGV